MQEGNHIKTLLKGCRRGNPRSQRKLYEHFYGYALSICLRYAGNREEAVEILNDAFYKILTQLDHYRPDQPFRPWLRRILINTAIDQHRRNQHQLSCLELNAAEYATTETTPFLTEGEDVLPMLQQLPPAYRLVFNLAIMEGYQHHEIARLLDISASTSRSNLMRAKEKLRTLWMEKHGKPMRAS